jgi:hypothetical protein
MKQALILFAAALMVPCALTSMAQAAQVKSHAKQSIKSEPRSLLIQKTEFS